MNVRFRQALPMTRSDICEIFMVRWSCERVELGHRRRTGLMYNPPMPRPTTSLQLLNEFLDTPAGQSDRAAKIVHGSSAPNFSCNSPSTQTSTPVAALLSTATANQNGYMSRFVPFRRVRM